MSRLLTSTSAVHVGTPAVASELDWEHVYDVHAPRLRRLIRRKVEAAAIEDVLQETFLRAFKSRHTIDRARPMKPWLNTIALRTIADVQRGAVRTVETIDVDTECDEMVLAYDALDEELLTQAKQNGIKHAFASLNSRHRRLLQLVDIEGMPYEYVARHEQMTTDAVKAALARARSNFRASYVVFTQKSGLFGAGALVGSLTVKARLRLQRYQDFVAHHAAGVGAASLAVAVVASATIPSTRPSPSEAFGTATGGMPVGHMVGGMQLLATLGTTPDASQAADSNGNSIRNPTQPIDSASSVSIGTNLDVGPQSSRFAVMSDSDIETPVADARNVLLVNVYCDNGVAADTACEIIDLAPPAP